MQYHGGERVTVMGYARNNPRRANGTRRTQVRTQVLREEDDCWICGHPVDKSLKTPHPASPEVDEVVPVSLGGDPLDRTNCRLSHRLCNIRRGNGMRKAKVKAEPKPLVSTRRWWGATP